MRRTEGALFNSEGLALVDRQRLEQLRALARESAHLRYRLCLHHSPEDPVQEMLVVHCRGNYSRPHAHPCPLTYVVLEGEMRVLLFDDRGVVTGSVDLGGFGGTRPFALRIEAMTWYMPVATTDEVVFHETKQGPFRRDQSNLWAPWSPEEDDDEGIASYRRRLGIAFER